VSGSRLGRYEVVRHLADGGMAEVLLARATGIENFEHHVVVKRIRGEQKKDERFVKMFLDEARLAAALHHQHVVQVHDIGQEGGEYFFAMEYVHGEDARKLLTHLNKKQQRLPLEHLLTIAMAALSGLHYAHDHQLQIVHRDVSPANILIGFDGGVKVADFGIAKAALRTQETRSGTLKGKVSYMSPEQCTGGAVDRRSDVFAMGIVLYELCTVRRLFKGENDFLTMTAIVQGGVPLPTTVRPDVPPGLETIIMTALALSPDRRYQTAEEMRLALEQLATDLGIRTSATALGSFMKKQFGERVEPWFTDEEVGEVMTIDFDGDEAGVAPATATNVPLPPDIRRSAPIAIAQPLEEDAVPEPARATPTSAGWTGGATASGTPIAWSPEPKQSDARRTWMIGAIAGVGLAILLLIFALVRTGGDAEDKPAATAQPAPTRTPQPPPPEPPPPEAPEPPAPEAPAPEPTAPAPTAGSAEPVVTAGSGLAKPPRPKRPRKPRPVQPGSTPKWDPTTLFPKK
jgi:serine/threonine protein kinase